MTTGDFPGNDLMLFTDGSVQPKSKVGYGAYLMVSEAGLSLEILNTMVKVKRFEDTSSTKLELQALLWALDDASPRAGKVIVYTDSQNIAGLIGRRNKLEQDDYFSKNNKRLQNHELYQKFYRLSDQMSFVIEKVKGHKTSSQKDDIDRLFSLVDKASRNALREDLDCCGQT